MSKTVVLHSGGLDSTVALYDALHDSDDVISFGVVYGATNEKREMQAAYKITDALKCERIVIGIDPVLFRGSGSMLMGEQPMAKEEYRDWMGKPEAEDGPSPTVVPFRNANLISMAVALAVSRDFDTVVAAMHMTDHEHWAYPDCTPAFVSAMQVAVDVGTMQRVELKVPFLMMKKYAVVDYGHKLEVPFHDTWSCYLSGDKHCGECPTCLERKKAFELSKVDDHTEYLK